MAAFDNSHCLITIHAFWAAEQLPLSIPNDQQIRGLDWKVSKPVNKPNLQDVVGSTGYHFRVQLEVHRRCTEQAPFRRRMHNSRKLYPRAMTSAESIRIAPLGGLLHHKLPLA